MKKINHFFNRGDTSFIIRLLSIISFTAISGLVNAQVELFSGKYIDFRLPDETIVINIGEEQQLAVQQQWLLELDDMDVSEMLQVEGEHLSYQPIQALIPGSHTIRLSKSTAEGEISEVASWRFEVRQSETFKQYGAAANVQLTDTYRADEHNLSEPLPKRQQVQGSSQFSYSADTGNWHTQGQFDLIYNSSNDGLFGARKLNNGEFLFSVANQVADIQVGHQNIGKADLVMDNFRRRGVSVGGTFSGINSHVTGFSLSSEDVVGFRRGLALGDSQRRVDGINFEVDPFSDETLVIHGTWLTGKEQDTSGLIGSIDDLEPGVSRGTAKSVSVNSQLLESRLQIAADYGNTRFNANTFDNTLDAISDNAYRVQLAYGDTTESGINWNAGFERSQVGTFFKSLANQGIGADIQLTQANAGLQWETVGLQASFQRQKDNVKRLVELPRTQTDLSSVSLSWTPSIENPDKWYGSPSFDGAYSKQDQKQTLLPSGTLLPETDSTLDNWQINSSFNYSSSSWGVSVGQNKFTDFTGIQNNTDTTTFSINASISLLEQKLTLAPTIQFDSSKDLATNITSDSVSYGVQSSFILLEDTLDGSILVNFNRNRITDNSINTNASSSALTLNWHALEAKPNRLGIDVGLNAQYDDTKDKIFTENSIGTYQVFLTISVVFPAQIGVVQ